MLTTSFQVFSDEFHLRTLDTLLAACLSLHEDVDILSIVATLIDRHASRCLFFPLSLFPSLY